jgi:membrane associated rhomboid family serine protease
MDGVSLETRAKIEADEQRGLLKKALAQLLYVAVSVTLWIKSGKHSGDPHFFFVGISALPAISTLWQWSMRLRLDPVEAANRPAVEAMRFDEKEALKAAFAGRKAYITYVMVAILVVVDVLQLALAGSLDYSIRAAGLVKSAAASGQWWRLITSTYLHGGILHVYGNVFALLILGSTMEAFVPRWHLPVVYLVSGLSGSLASFFLLKATSVGASGAILGLAGYLLTVGALEPARLPRPVRLQALIMIALTAYTGAFGFGFIDNAAHFGGALGGAFAAWVLTPRGEDHTGTVPPQWNLAGVVASALIVISAAGTARVLAGVPRLSTVVSTARASLRDEGANSFVELENRGDRTLEAYRFKVTIDGQTVASGWRDDCCFGPVNRQQPIAPHSSVQIPVARAFGVSVGKPKATISLAVFDDGSFEGRREEFDELVKQRKFVADDAAYWRSVIYQQQDANFKLRLDAFTKAYASQKRSAPLGQSAGEALGIPQLIFAADTNPEAYAAVAAQTSINLNAIESALRARIAAFQR